MNYIAIYIPLNGEIKVGDRVQSESFHKAKVLVTGITEKGDYITDEADIWEYDSYFILPKDKAKKFSKNLYLVSRDIKIGDKVLSPNLFKETIIGDNKLLTLESYKVYGYFKVIGEISKDAIWVNEGDEFKEGEFSCNYDLASTSRRNFNLESEGYKLYDEGIDNEGKVFSYRRLKHIKIKCPTCKTFH